MWFEMLLDILTKAQWQVQSGPGVSKFCSGGCCLDELVDNTILTMAIHFEWHRTQHGHQESGLLVLTN
jgi:hypothetical protein